MDNPETSSSSTNPPNEVKRHPSFIDSHVESSPLVKQPSQSENENIPSSTNLNSGAALPDFSLASNADLKFDIPDVDYNYSPISPVKQTQRLINPIVKGPSSGTFNVNPSGNSELESVSNLDLASFASIGDNIPMLPTPNFSNDYLLDTTVTPSEIPDSFIIEGSNAESSNIKMNPQSSQSNIISNPIIYSTESTLSKLPLNSEGIPIRTCEICRQAIESDGLFTNGLYYHKTCAKCFKCGCQIEPPYCSYLCDILVCPNCAKKSSIFNKDASLVHSSSSSFTLPQSLSQKDSLPKCAVCNEVLNGTKSIVALEEGIIVHTNCLSCFECSKVLIKGHQKILDGKIYCRRCYSFVSERVCQVCNQVIIGSFVKSHKRFYHPNHFICSTCKIILNGNNYVIHHNKLYCPAHGKYFSDHCAFCKRALYLTNEEMIRFNGKIYHTICFVCRVCGTSLRPETAKLFHSRPHCMDCYQKRIRESTSGSEKQRYKHIPDASVQRRIRFMEDGIQIILPQYESRENRFFETAKPMNQEHKNENRPGLIHLSSLEFEDL